MSENMDLILERLAEMTNAIKEHNQEGNTSLDWETIKAQFQPQMDALVAAQVAEQIAKQPIRRGDPITAYNVEMLDRAGELSGNRYAKAVRDIAKDGYTRWGPKRVKAVDLWLAKNMLDAQMRIKQSGAYMAGQDNIAPASDDLTNALKALTSTGSGTGDELVPTDLADQLWDDFFLTSKVVNALSVIEMPTNPFDVPLGLGNVTWYKGSENTATTASDPATAKSTLTVTELVTEQGWSYTLNEDAAVAMAPEIRRRLAISGAEIMDDFAINADSTDAGTGNINLDDANPTDTNYYLSDGQDGLRKQWLVDNTSQTVAGGGDALVDAEILSALTLQGKYAVNPEQNIMICDVSTYLKGLLDLDAVLTIDKFGPAAVVLTGQLAAYRGIPIIVSASHRLAEADGKLSTTTGNNTLGSISFVNRMMWYVGFRRRIMIEVDRNIQTRKYIMVTSLRQAIAAHGTRASNTHTSGIANLLVA